MSQHLQDLAADPRVRRAADFRAVAAGLSGADLALAARTGTRPPVLQKAGRAPAADNAGNPCPPGPHGGPARPPPPAGDGPGGPFL